MYKKYLNKKRRLPGLLGTILLLLLLQVSSSSFAQQKKFSLSGTNMPLRELFKEIKKQTGISVIVTTNMLRIANPVNIKVTNAELTDVLNYVFSSQPLSYTFHKKSIVIKLKDQEVRTTGKAMPKMNYKTDIHGKVTDGRLLPLPGVSVTLDGTGVQVVTDQNGNFALQEIPEEGVLNFSYIGYEKQLIPVQGVKEFSVIMKLHVEDLKEVAVVSTGYQNIEKERATGSFSKPDMKQFNNRQGTTDIISKLEGLVPGLLITTGPNSSISSGAINTGNSTRKSTIRGESSISVPTDPLYVVNGVPVKNINLFNPDDIAEITVLKDAAASAIWGAQAANGVIVITTKSAEKNGKLSISYSGSFNFQGKPDYSYGKMMNSEQFIQTAKEIFDPVAFPYESLSNSVIAPHEQILYNQYAKYGNRNLDAGAVHSLDSLAGINNIDQVRDLWNRNGLVQTHTVSISGGSNVYSFYTSAAYADTKSSTVGQSDRNYRITLNQDYNPGKRLRLSLNTTLGRRYFKEANPITISNEFLPYQLFEDASGKSLSMPYLMSLSPELRSLYESRSGISLDYNPLDELNLRSVNVNSTHINIAGSVKLSLFKGLSFNGNYGFQFAPGQRTRYTDHKQFELRKNLIGYTVAPTDDAVPLYYMPTSGGTYEELNYEERNWTLRNQLVYTASLRSGKDRLNLQLGQEARESLGRSTSNSVYGYDQHLQIYPQLNWGSFIPNTLTGGNRVPDAPGPVFYENLNRFTSYFALANYNISDKYSIDASWRVDHSALFGSDKSAQNKPIWSIGGRWNVHKEDFMSKISWLNGLSFRATYGITGNSPFSGSATQWDILSKGFSMSTPLAGPYVNVMPKNAKLSWESTATTNLGLDFSVLDSRLTASVDIYRKKTTDLLGTVIFNNLTGFKQGSGNIGDLSNKGIEASIASVNIRGRNFSWSSNLNFAFNKNKLLSYSAVDPRSDNASGRLGLNKYQIGYPIQPLFSYVYAGLDASGNPQIKLTDGTITSTPYSESKEDLVYEGSMIASYTGGLGNQFRYKAFNLSVNMIFNLGNVMRADVNGFYTGRSSQSDGFTGNLTTDFLNRWKVPGDEQKTDVPVYIPGYESYNRNPEFYTKADINVVSASYAKIRDITLSFNLPEQILQKLKVKSANVGLQATNFMVWKANNRGIDPEFHELNAGARMLPPYKHAYSLTVNFTF